ncbi:DUF4277 domain-containing protein [Paenibacillus ehimensis]|uniref:DUF4277 domain-containing protein n=1 Tax=Paenibacillus ehimensis TaxID=79264 RepID=UPI00398B5300
MRAAASCRPVCESKPLVINVLSGKDPLCHVKRFYRDQDVELLFGDGVTADDLNDDALARAHAVEGIHTSPFMPCESLGCRSIHCITTRHRKVCIVLTRSYVDIELSA